MRGAAAGANLSELRPQASPLTAIDVGLRAASLGSVQLLTVFRIPRDLLRSHATQTANVRRKLPSLAGIERVTGGHLGALDAISDHQKQGFVIRRMPQSRLRQHRASAALAFGPVASRALPQE